jgi:hypothetical protein
MKFIVKVKNSGYIYNINQQHMIMMFTDNKRNAKKFISPQSARSYVNKYSDAGYGLNSDDQITIEEVV